MYCKKCKYTTFDHLTRCPQCGYNWQKEKKSFGLDWLNFELKFFQNIPVQSFASSSVQEVNQGHSSSAQEKNEEFIEINMDESLSKNESPSQEIIEKKAKQEEKNEDFLEINIDEYLADSSLNTNHGSTANEISEIENIYQDDLLEDTKVNQPQLAGKDSETEKDIYELLKDVEEIDKLLDDNQK